MHGKKRRTKMRVAKLSVVVVLLMSLFLVSCSGSPTQAPQGSTAPNEVLLKGFAFNPVSLTVKVGTTVTWTNEDDAIHTVTSDTGVFESGDLAKGDTFTYTFTQAGVFSYHCEPHKQNMTGTITVTE
jgi:plastocyanin